MTSAPLHKIPTGIHSLDVALRGGFPSGSFIVLLGEAGSGHAEFACTSAVRTAELIGNGEEWQRLSGELQGLGGEESRLPEKICYVTFARSKRDIQQELARTFGAERVAALERVAHFREFAELYYSSTVAPTSWVAREEGDLSSLKRSGSRKSLLEELVYFLDIHARDSLVILDSLTSLVRCCADEVGWSNLLSLLEGLQRVAKEWDGVVYGLLGAGVLEARREEEVAELVDGVLRFEWEQRGASGRQQTMHIQKFRGLLPQLAKDSIVKFETSVVAGSGFEMLNVRRVAGR